MAPASRQRKRACNKWWPPTPQEMYSASRDAASADLQPWLEHPTLVDPHDRLQHATLALITAGPVDSAQTLAPAFVTMRSYANGEISHFLRSHGFLLKLPPSWRELHAWAQKLLQHGTSGHEVPGLLGITTSHWEQIVQACSVRVVASSSDDVQ